MSKRKRKHKGRRRVGARGGFMKPSNLLKLGSIAAGYLMADTINAEVDKLAKTKNDAGVETVNENLAIGGSLGAGAAAMFFLGKKKGMVGMAANVGGGLLIGAGLKRVAKKAGIISGYQAVPVLGRKRMAGYQNVPVLGKMPPQLAGVPPQMQGFRVNGYNSQGSGVMAGSIGSASGSGINSGSGYMN